MAGTDDAPLYDRLGGRDAIAAALEAFHDRVARDDRVNHYFHGVDLEALLRHQRAFFEARTGGPDAYDGREIAAVHAPFGIDDRDFDVFAGHLEETLLAFEVPGRERRELGSLVEAYRSAVVAE